MGACGSGSPRETRLVPPGPWSWARIRHSQPARAELRKIFFKPLRVIGSTMGTRAELAACVRMLVTTGVRPVIDRVLPLARAAEGFAAMIAGEGFGKIVFEP